MENEHRKVKKEFGFHVPIVKEEDGHYYALCVETNEVSFGDDLSCVIRDMHVLILEKIHNAAKAKQFSALFSDSMHEVYMSIYNQLKNRHNINEAEKIDEFLSGKNSIPNGEVKHLEERCIEDCYGSVSVRNTFEVRL